MSEHARLTLRNDEIQQLYMGGKHSLRQVAAQFGISHERVRQILNGRGTPINPPFESLDRS